MKALVVSFFVFLHFSFTTCLGFFNSLCYLGTVLRLYGEYPQSVRAIFSINFPFTYLLAPLMLWPSLQLIRFIWSCHFFFNVPLSHIFLSFFGVVVLIDDLGVSRGDCVPHKVSPCDVLPSDLGVTYAVWSVLLQW